MDYVTKATDTITSFPTDMLAIGVILIVLIVAIFYKARRLAIVLLISAYPALLIYQFLPFGPDEITSTSAFIQELVTFAVILTVTHYILRRYIKRHYVHPEGLKNVLQTVVLALSVLTLLLLLLVTIIPVTTLYPLSEQITTLFSEQYRIWWTLAPLVGIAIVNK